MKVKRWVDPRQLMELVGEITVEQAAELNRKYARSCAEDDEPNFKAGDLLFRFENGAEISFSQGWWKRYTGIHPLFVEVEIKVPKVRKAKK